MSKINIFKTLTLLAFFLITPLTVQAEEATLDEAKAHAQKAAAYIKDHGPEAALAEFNNKESTEFVVKDLYVFAVDQAGAFTAHPIKPALVGKNMIAMKDIDGFPLIKAFTEVESEGWVDYKWPHPQTKKIQDKSSYIIRVGDIILGVGAYK